MDKLLKHSNPITGNGTDCELVEWTSESLRSKWSLHFPTHHQPWKWYKRTKW